MKIKGKAFVVTGAGGGIGGELVKTLLARGASVAAVDLRDEGLIKLKDARGYKAERLSIHTLDITERSAVEALPEATIHQHDHIDGLINCAGIIQPFEKINNLSLDAIEKVMNVNYFGTVLMTKAFLPHLLQRPEGYVANVSSMGGFLPVPGQAAYGASKAAVKLFTEGLYAELLNTNTHVSVVFPGATNTEIAGNSGVTAPSGAEEASQDYKTLSASEVAEQIVRGIEKNKPRILTGRDSKSMSLLYRLSPVFATKFITKQMKTLLEE